MPEWACKTFVFYFWIEWFCGWLPLPFKQMKVTRRPPGRQ